MFNWVPIFPVHRIIRLEEVEQSIEPTGVGSPNKEIHIIKESKLPITHDKKR